MSTKVLSTTTIHFKHGVKNYTATIETVGTDIYNIKCGKYLKWENIHVPFGRDHIVWALQAYLWHSGRRSLQNCIKVVNKSIDQ